MVDSEGNIYGPRVGPLSPSTSTRYKTVGIRGKAYYVHRLVAEAFIPNPFDKPDVAHWDNDSMNNHASNLRWATEAENMADKRRHGTHTTCERIGTAKLTNEQVAYIRSCKGQSWGIQSKLAEQFAVSEATVSEIMNGWHWKDVA
ncbi:HNH endonuclease [Nocardia sp. NPDC001965]